MSRTYVDEIMEAVHLDGWDYLECPLCNEELWFNNMSRCDFPMIEPFGWCD